MPTSTAETDSMPESTPNPTTDTNPAQNACGGLDRALDEVVGDGELCQLQSAMGEPLGLLNGEGLRVVGRVAR
jgi:hypothetical protein